MTDTLFTLDPVEFRLPTPDCKKNNMQVIRIGGFSRLKPKKHIVQQEEAIKLHLMSVLPVYPHFADRDVAVHIIHYARSDELEVCVIDRGPRPKGFTGRRRDLHNTTDVLMDAMQGAVFANDNQVVELRMVRRLT